MPWKLRANLRGPAGESGARGLRGLSIVGAKGRDGSDGLNGSQILFLDSAPTDEGNNGDLVLINNTFDLYYKEDDEWIKKGSLLGKAGKNSFVAGLNGESAYQIAVKYGFSGTEEEWINSLGGAQVDYAQVVDEASDTVTYIGKAVPGSAENAAVWQIKKITISGTETITTWADGDVQFNNVWDNRTGLTYT